MKPSIPNSYFFDFKRTDRDYWLDMFNGNVTRLQLCARFGDIHKIDKDFLNGLTFDDWNSYEEIYSVHLSASVSIRTMLYDIAGESGINYVPLEILRQFPQEEWIKPKHYDARYIPFEHAVQAKNLAFIIKHSLFIPNKDQVMASYSNDYPLMLDIMRSGELKKLPLSVLRSIKVTEWFNLLFDQNHLSAQQKTQIWEDNKEFLFSYQLWQGRLDEFAKFWSSLPSFMRNCPENKHAYENTVFLVAHEKRRPKRWKNSRNCS